jgi:hypothetical protein
MSAAEVWAIGRIADRDGPRLWPSARAERLAAAADAAVVLASHGIIAADPVVVVSMMGEGVQFVPVEDAIEHLQAVVMPLDATARDAKHLAAFVRSYSIRAVVGLGRAPVDALAGSGCLELLQGVPLVFARSDVHADLRAAGIAPLACDVVGPTLALECSARAGAHVIGGWQVAVDSGADGSAGRVVLSNDRHAAVRTDCLRRVVVDHCACGCAAPRLEPA